MNIIQKIKESPKYLDFYEQLKKFNELMNPKYDIYLYEHLRGAYLNADKEERRFLYNRLFFDYFKLIFTSATNKELCIIKDKKFISFNKNKDIRVILDKLLSEEDLNLLYIELENEIENYERDK